MLGILARPAHRGVFSAPSQYRVYGKMLSKQPLGIVRTYLTRCRCKKLASARSVHRICLFPGIHQAELAVPVGNHAGAQRYRMKARYRRDKML